jgi:hypothetical protein
MSHRVKERASEHDQDDVLKLYDEYLEKVRIALAKQDSTEQLCNELKMELDEARHHISALEKEIMETNNCIMSKIENLDSVTRHDITIKHENLSNFTNTNKVLELTYSLDVFKTAKKSQDKEISILKAENSALKRENALLRDSLNQNKQR